MWARIAEVNALAMRLSLCIIVRDSSRTLDACLSSIRPWVDEIVVVDTGSTDHTREIALRHGARLFEFPWCDDFAAARNESLKHAVGDWVFWMDSDDTISYENGRKLRSLADCPKESAPTAYVMQVHCPGSDGSTDCTVVDHVKMFRNDPRLRFEGRIHEQILGAIRRLDGTVEWSDVYVTHSGSEHTPDARKRKQDRDLRLLFMDLAERPEHPFVLFNLGMTYADMNDLEQAADYLKRCLKVSAPEESHVRKAYALLVGCLTQLDRDNEARRVVKRGMELCPHDVELAFRLGILEQRAKNHTAAIEAYQCALTPTQVRCFTSRDRGISGHKARHNLAGIYREIGKLEHAELQWRLALDDEPNYREGWLGLVETLLELRRYVTLEVEIEAAIDRGIPKIETSWASARLSATRGDFEGAVATLDGVIGDDVASLVLLRLKCQLLFEHGSDDRAIAVLEELCRRCPEDGATWHNLGSAQQRAGCNALAESSYRKSLAARPNSVPTMLQLGYAQHALGRFEAAKRTWKSASEIAPDDPALKAALSLMECEPITA
jgi:tetratricopeptide (TPR) repeat protein